MAQPVAIVTGASRGVGRAIARRLLMEDWRVAGVARSEEALRDMEKEWPSFRGFVADVRDKARAKAIVEEVEKTWGPVDALIANAGVGHYAPTWELSEDHWDEMLEVNLKGPFLWSQAVLPSMMARKKGHLLFISSVAGTTTFPGGAGYCASKWGLMALADTLRQEVKPYELRVTVVAPGSIQTGFAGSPIKPYSLLPEDVAEACWHALSAPERVIYGTIIMRPKVPGELGGA